ncbi:hypothetical protein CUMW_181430 [Citrus unshiu]|uniref:Uncharacterized protein n=1 Tax=Citrus unshiu TaxID=55188 RepID=A0A2H5PZE1_CITUN|nr:hypothetical protein CUMW_181430 [Citrus unshiu]
MPLTLSINIKLMNRPKLKPIQCFQINGSDLYSRISSLEPFLHESPTILTPFLNKTLRSLALAFTCCSKPAIFFPFQ